MSVCCPPSEKFLVLIHSKNRLVSAVEADSACRMRGMMDLNSSAEALS